MEISVWNIFFCTVFFSAHGFANSRAYKIKNTGVDGPCPSYKIKSIAFEQRKTLGLWMSFGWPFGLLDGHRKYQELGFPTGCGEKRWKCHHNTSKIKEWKIVKKMLEFQCNILKMNQSAFANWLWREFETWWYFNTFEIITMAFARTHCKGVAAELHYRSVFSVAPSLSARELYAASGASKKSVNLFPYLFP